MIPGLLVLLLCQLVGELLTRTFQLAVPGPVLGMLLLLILLGVRGEKGVPAVERAADAVLDELPLLFIPAGVGVVGYVALIRQQWLPVAGGMVLAWAAGLLATAGAAALVLRLQHGTWAPPTEAESLALAEDAERMDGYEPEPRS